MEDREKLSCFGNLDAVFPMGEGGLRESPEACLLCEKKTECLKLALKGRQGLQAAEEKLDHAYASGHVGFFTRWSKKKALVLKKKKGQ